MQNREKEPELISVKKASYKLSMGYYTLIRLISGNPNVQGVYKIGKSYKIDLPLYLKAQEPVNLPKDISFNKLRDYYEVKSGAFLNLGKKTKYTHKRALNLGSEFFFNKDFNEQSLFEFRNWILVNKNIGEATAQKYLYAIKKMCEIGEQVGLVQHIKDDYLKGLKRKSSKRFLTKEERERIRAYANENILDYIEFAIETGLRKEELLNLTWDNVYFDDKKIFIPKRKAGDTLILRISKEAWEILEKRKVLISPFPKFRYEEYDKALKDAGITKVVNGEKCTFHTLRHTFASWSLMGWHSWQNGKQMSVYDIKRLLGHKKLSTTEKYLHLDSSEIDKIFELES